MHPVLFACAGLRVYSYGALIALGGIFSVLIWNAKRENMGLRKADDFWLFVNVILISGFIGGRVLYIIEYVPFSGPELWAAVFSFNKGFSVLGAFASVAGGIWLFARRLKLEFLRLLDYASLIAPFWHVFGRLGCFAAGCCYGRPTIRPWAVRFTDPVSMVPENLLGTPLHPVQLYEAFGELGIFLVLFFIILPRVERGRVPRGVLTGMYFAAYGVLRIVVEFYRGDTVSGCLGLSSGQGLSLGLVLAGFAFVAWVCHKPCTRS